MILTSSHLASKKYQPQISSHYYVTISGRGEDLSFTAASVQQPEIGNEQIDLPFGNENFVKISGRRTYGDMEITFYDSVGADIYNQLQEIMNEAYNPVDGTVGYLEEYAHSVTVVSSSPDDKVERIDRYPLCWLGNLKRDALDSSQSGIVKCSCTWKVASCPQHEQG